MTVSRSIHISTNDPISLPFMNEQYSILYMYHIFTYSCVDGHLGSFHILAIVNSAPMNFGVRWSELPSSQNLQTINAGRGGQQSSYTVGGSANQYSHYGEVYGGYLKS